MSDEFAKQVEKDASPLPDGRSVSLSVTMHPNGQVEYSLPTNLVLAHGLLGMAAAKLTELQMTMEFKTKQGVRGGLNGLLRKATGG